MLNELLETADALPCPNCKNDFQTGPSWDGKNAVWWDCECGLCGPVRTTLQEAVLAWNEMVSNAPGEQPAANELNKG